MAYCLIFMIAKTRKKKRLFGFKKLFFGAFKLILLAVVVGFLAVTNFRLKESRAKLEANLSELQNEVQIAKEENEILKKNISRGESREYLEKLAREQFNLKAPGEEVVVISREKGKENADQGKDFLNPQDWWNWLKNQVRD